MNPCAVIGCFVAQSHVYLLAALFKGNVTLPSVSISQKWVSGGIYIHCTPNDEITRNILLRPVHSPSDKLQQSLFKPARTLKINVLMYQRPGVSVCNPISWCVISLLRKASVNTKHGRALVKLWREAFASVNESNRPFCHWCRDVFIKTRKGNCFIGIKGTVWGSMCFVF